MGDGARVVAFIEFVRYDEATTLMSVEQASDVWTELPEDDDEDADMRALLQRLLAEDTVVEAAPTKLFQTESRWGALVAVDKLGEASEYVIVTSEMAQAGQVLQHTTAKNISEALLRSSMVRPRSLASVDCCLRIICSD